jgi:hypothetical protein
VYIDDVSLSHTTGVEEEMENNFISVYPNPATDQFKVTAGIAGQLQFILFDPLGQLLKTETFSGTTTISLDDFAKGIYFYEVRGENGVIGKGKVVKE